MKKLLLGLFFISSIGYGAPRIGAPNTLTPTDIFYLAGCVRGMKSTLKFQKTPMTEEIKTYVRNACTKELLELRRLLGPKPKRIRSNRT